MHAGFAKRRDEWTAPHPGVEREHVRLPCVVAVGRDRGKRDAVDAREEVAVERRDAPSGSEELVEAVELHRADGGLDVAELVVVPETLENRHGHVTRVRTRAVL